VKRRAALVLLVLAGAVWAQGAPPPAAPPAPRLDTRLDAATVRDCGSAVVQRCEAPAPAPPEARDLESRRTSEAQSLERMVVEGQRLRGAEVERVIAEQLGEGIVKPGDTREVTGHDGSRCTCMRRCPPVPFACCSCSAPPDRPTRSF
jgi:hypothetical protein